MNLPTLSKKFARSLRRRACAGIALVSYLLTAVGFPLPVLRKFDSGVPYPCQHHACGCIDAEQCWRDCCCLSVAERLAWARRQNLEPPSFPDAPASKGWRSKRVRDQQPSCPSCVQCNDSETPDTAPVCKKETNSGTAVLLGIAALRCQGGSTLWVNTGAVVTTTRLVWRAWLIQVATIESSDTFASQRSPMPPIRPPRISVATFCL